MRRLLLLTAVVVLAAACCPGNVRLGTSSGHFDGVKAEQEAIVIVSGSGGFDTRVLVADMVAIAVAESGLFPAARNWYYDLPRTDHSECCHVDTLHPLDMTQPCAHDDPVTCSADRGLFQINSRFFGTDAAHCATSDEAADTPSEAVTKARCIYDLQGLNAWSAWVSGAAQRFLGPYDGTVLGWPAVVTQVDAYCAAHNDAWCGR